MTDRLGARPLDDAALGAALRDLATAIDWPTGPTTPDLATRVRVAISERTAAPAARRRWTWRPASRALALALVALLVLAAVAGAVALGLPGLRFILAEPTAPPPTPAPSATAPAGPPGSRLGLGTLTTLEAAEAQVGRPIAVPTDPAIGPPDAVYVDPAKGDSVALVWAADDTLPATLAPGVGLIVQSFDGTIQDELYGKLISAGSLVERVAVDGADGFWISGDPHLFFFETATGEFIEDQRRWVGEVMAWSADGTTTRIESALGRDATLALAEALEP